jgi:hypothetical protein
VRALDGGGSGDTGALRRSELGGIKAGPNNRSRIRCRRLHWGRVKGARGRRGHGEMEGPEEDERQKAMGWAEARYERKGGPQWLWVGLALASLQG